MPLLMCLVGIKYQNKGKEEVIYRYVKEFELNDENNYSTLLRNSLVLAFLELLKIS